MERKTALWEEVKATSLQEIDGDRLADLPLIFDGPYPIGRSMMGWVEMEMIWKYSWRR
uniref:Alternative protein NGFRAP1 n=1 Tax=Homo sapiens TaxID=9606 RepID=Q14991_HUMAN|nr:unknown [Homo sapiens]CCQ43433.1 alternative protein NGFRAP1 [Homo sapiens]